MTDLMSENLPSALLTPPDGEPRTQPRSGGALTATKWMLDGVQGIRDADAIIKTEHPEQYHLRARRWAFSDVSVADVTQTPARVEPKSLDEAEQEYVSVSFIRQGGYDLFDGNRRLHFEAGQVGFVPGWMQYAAENREMSRIAMVSVHQDRLAAQGITPRTSLGLFGDKTRLRKPCLSFVLALMDQLNTPVPPESAGQGAEPDSLAGEPTATVLSQLVAGLFLEDAGYRMDSPLFATGLRARAEALIARQAVDPNFTPQVLAELLNVSLRHLQRSFSETGMGPAEAIRGKRLEAALNALRLASQAPRSVAEIAAGAGFSSVKELRYALRTTYGITPRELLAGRPLDALRV